MVTHVSRTGGPNQVIGWERRVSLGFSVGDFLDVVGLR